MKRRAKRHSMPRDLFNLLFILTIPLAALGQENDHDPARSNEIYAIDLATGVTKWKFAHLEQGYSSSTQFPIYFSDGVIFSGNDAGTLHLVDIKTGEKLDEITRAGGIGLYFPQDETLYFGNSFLPNRDPDRPSTISALSLPNRKVEWITPLQAPSDYVLMESAVSALDSRLAIGDISGRLYVLNRSSGKVEWGYQPKKEETGMPSVICNLMAANGSVYFNYFGELPLIALDITNGTEKFRFQVEGEIEAPPLFAGDTLYVVNGDPFVAYHGVKNVKNFVHALDPNTGHEKWKYELEDESSGSPAISNGNLFVATKKGHVYSISLKDGSLLWRNNVDEPIWTSPIVYGQNIYLVSRSLQSAPSLIITLNSKSGKFEEKRALPSHPGSSLANNGILYYRSMPQSGF